MAHVANILVAGAIIVLLGLRITGTDVPLLFWQITASLCFLANLDRMNGVAKTFFAIAVLIWIAGALHLSEIAPSATNASSSFFMFILIMGFLSYTTERSRRISTFFAGLRSTSGLRKYVTLNLQTFLLSLILNVGSVHLLAPLAIRRGEEGADQPELRRQALAIIRGFGVTPLWSPLSIAPLLVTSLVAGVSYRELLLPGLIISAGMLLLGWVMERALMRGKPAPEARQTPRTRPDYGVLATLLSVVACISVIALAAGHFLKTSTIESISFAVFSTAFTWALGQGLFAQPATRILAEISAITRRTSREGIMISSVVIMSATVAEISRHVNLAEMHTSVLGSSLIAAVIPAVFLAGGALAINPTVTASLLAAFLAPGWPTGGGLWLAVAMVWGWSMTVSFGPFTGSSLAVSSAVGTSSFVMTYRWNRGYTLTVLSIASPVLFLGTWLAIS